MTTYRNYFFKMENEFPELWGQDGELTCGDKTWMDFANRLDIEVKDDTDVIKEIYVYLKKHPEVVSFLAL